MGRSNEMYWKAYIRGKALVLRNDGSLSSIFIDILDLNNLKSVLFVNSPAYRSNLNLRVGHDAKEGRRESDFQLL